MITRVFFLSIWHSAQVILRVPLVRQAALAYVKWALLICAAVFLIDVFWELLPYVALGYIGVGIYRWRSPSEW